jgi:beta-carotene hydroxylase
MLHYKADLRTLAFVFLYFVFAALPWFIWDTLTTPQIILLVAINCFFSFSCAVIIHNTVHKPIFKSRNLNKLMQITLCFTYGHPVSAYVPGHNFSHHKYTQKAKDAIRTSKMRFKLNILNQLLFLPTMAGDILSSEVRFAKKMRTENPSWFRQYIIEFALVIGVTIVLFIMNWKCALLFFVLPHYYAAWGIVGTNYFQHDGCDEDHEYNHSRNFTSPLLNWFLFNNGFHGAHHARPSLHWSLLPAYHEKEIRPYIHPNLDRDSLIPYLIEAHIYPAKRLDYLGNQIVLPPAGEEEDWVAEIKTDAHKADMAGAV